jgi:hypothetical protein
MKTENKKKQILAIEDEPIINLINDYYRLTK